jgi:tetratricopeptide (TPR) repeat protein
MGASTHLVELREFAKYLSQSLLGKAEGKLRDRTPCSSDDPQEQIETAIRLMESSRSHKESGDYALAGFELAENLRYYSATGDTGKCGYTLLEIADCLFCAKQFDTSIECCAKAIPLLVESMDRYSWARGISAVGELLLAALVLYLREPAEAQESLRNFTSSLAIKEKMALSREDAHRIARKLVKAYKLKSPAPLEELREIAPRRKRTDQENLFALLEEWMDHFSAIRQAVNKILLENKSGSNTTSNRET